MSGNTIGDFFALSRSTTPNCIVPEQHGTLRDLCGNPAGPVFRIGAGLEAEPTRVRLTCSTALQGVSIDLDSRIDFNHDKLIAISRMTYARLALSHFYPSSLGLVGAQASVTVSPTYNIRAAERMFLTGTGSVKTKPAGRLPLFGRQAIKPRR